MGQSEKAVTEEALKRFCSQAFEKLGVPSDDAKIVSDVLVSADIRGIDSHGVARLSRYVNDLKTGRALARLQFQVVHETPVTAVVDGGAGLGPAVAHRAMELAISKARSNHIGVAVVRNSNHYGIAGYYAMMALDHDMIGISSTNAKAVVLPTFGRESMLGTNPISIAVPTGRERPFVLDMATSAVPQGKLEVYERLGKPIPLGWATDVTGRLTTDPSLVLKNIAVRKGGGLLPLGGIGEEMGGHKGFGLAMVVDILCAVLSGASPSDLSYQQESGRPLPSDLGHFFAAIRVNAFRPVAEFKKDMDDLIQRIRNTPRLEESERIYIHGEKEFETTERRRREGIPLNPKVVVDLQAIAKELGLPPPL